MVDYILFYKNNVTNSGKIIFTRLKVSLRIIVISLRSIKYGVWPGISVILGSLSPLKETPPHNVLYREGE